MTEIPLSMIHESMPQVLIGPKDKLIDFPDTLKIFDDKSYGFDYQEHLIRKVFNEMRSEIQLFLVYEDYKKSAGFDISKVYPKDSAEGLKTVTKTEAAKLTDQLIREAGCDPKKKENLMIYKSCHWTPFLDFYIDNQFWKIEYKKFIKTLEHYKKAFYSFNHCHLDDQEIFNHMII